LAFLLRS